MRLVICLPLARRAFTDFGVSASTAAFINDKSLMRCAPQSAWISVHGTPQTFSLWVLKKCSYSRQPNRDATNPSRVCVSLGLRMRTQKYDSMQRTASIGPRFVSAFLAEIG